MMDENKNDVIKISQLGADMWVYSHFQKGYKGVFVDVGCADGQYISNTWFLEKMGWSGVAIDANPRNFECRTNTKVVKSVVSDVKNKDVEFLIPTMHDDFAGITDKLGKFKETLLKLESDRIMMKTSLLVDILKENETSKRIDYISLDIEGSEFDVLSTFPFDQYEIGLITVEHNFEEPKRTHIKKLLEGKGFVLDKSEQWDDWYKNPSYFMG